MVACNHSIQEGDSFCVPKRKKALIQMNVRAAVLGKMLIQLELKHHKARRGMFDFLLFGFDMRQI